MEGGRARRPGLDDDRLTTAGRDDDRLTTAGRDDDRLTTAGRDDDRLTTAGRDDDRLTTAGGTPIAAAHDPRSAPAPPPPRSRPSGHDRFQPGATVLDGKFDLVARMKGGAQALAFRGRRVVDDVDVFIKVQLNPGRDPDFFQKQISMRGKMLSIDHPLLMHVHDIGLDGGELCEVYEFVHGEQFSDWIAASRPLSDARIENIVAQLAEALNALHEATGLAHRDLKPDNLMVETDGASPRLRIVDYGAVSHIDSGGVTRVLGTRDYSPPEFYGRWIENDPLLRSWDWWNVGRILQEVIDGCHPKDRLRAMFPEMMILRPGDVENDVVMAMFDGIMLESNLEKYQMRAGMVELSEKNPAGARWMPLLRGLLTTNRAGRWDYAEVIRFLRGEKVPNAYHQPREVNGFLFEQDIWSLPDLAKTLAAQSHDAPARWETAKQLLYAGDILRYVHDIMHNIDLERKLQKILSLPDKDLGTGLALSALADGALIPSIRGTVVDRAYARSLAVTGGTDAETKLYTLLSSDFLAALKVAAPDQAEGLETLAAEAGALFARMERLDIDYGQSKLTAPYCESVGLLTTPEGEIVSSIVTDCQPRFVHTENETLQALYAAPDLFKLPPVDLRALRVSLNHANRNRYVDCEQFAAALRREAVQYAKAAAARRASGSLSRLFRLFLLTGKGVFPAVIWSVIGLGCMIHGAVVSQAAFPAGFVNVRNILSIPASALVIGVLFLTARKVYTVALWKDLRVVYDDMPLARVNAVSLKGVAQAWNDHLGGKDLSKEVRLINTRIRAVPGINLRRYLVQNSPFVWSRLWLVVMVSMAYFVVFRNAQLAQMLGRSVATATATQDRAAETHDVPVSLPAVPPVTFRSWVKDVAYTTRIWDLRHVRPGHKIDDAALLAGDAVTLDTKAMEAAAGPLRDYEAHTAQSRLWPFYYELFTYIHMHNYSLATSDSSPFMAVAWNKVRTGEQMRYLNGLNRTLTHRATGYQPWTNYDWRKQLKHR